MDEIKLTSTDLANLFGVSVRQIQRLTLDGIISPVSDQRPYRYSIETVCPQYCSFLQAKIAAREKTNAIADLEESKLAAEVEFKKTRAATAKLELEELQGKLHRAEDVEAITTDHVLYMRSMLMAIPGRLAVDCAKCSKPAEVSEILQKEVYYILSNLADYRYDPEKYAARIRERQGWNNQADTADE